MPMRSLLGTLIALGLVGCAHDKIPLTNIDDTGLTIESTGGW